MLIAWQCPVALIQSRPTRLFRPDGEFSLQLDWHMTAEIAQALEAANPHCDIAGLSGAELRAMIVGLPGFSGPPLPDDPRHVSAAHTIWLDIAALDAESPGACRV